MQSNLAQNIDAMKLNKLADWSVYRQSTGMRNIESAKATGLHVNGRNNTNLRNQMKLSISCLHHCLIRTNFAIRMMYQQEVSSGATLQLSQSNNNQAEYNYSCLVRMLIALRE